MYILLLFPKFSFLSYMLLSMYVVRGKKSAKEQIGRKILVSSDYLTLDFNKSIFNCPQDSVKLFLKIIDG